MKIDKNGFLVFPEWDIKYGMKIVAKFPVNFAPPSLDHIPEGGWAERNADGSWIVLDRCGVGGSMYFLQMPETW